MLVQQSVVIHRPVAEVFAALVDFEAAPERQPAVRGSWHTPTGAVRLGTRTYHIRSLFGRRMVSTSIVTAFELNRKMVCVTLTGVSPRACTTYIVEPVKDGGELTVAIEVEISGIPRVIAPVLKYMLIKHVARRFATLKERLECQPRGS
jgi:hypothetical protein